MKTTNFLKAEMYITLPREFGSSTRLREVLLHISRYKDVRVVIQEGTMIAPSTLHRKDIQKMAVVTVLPGTQEVFSKDSWRDRAVVFAEYVMKDLAILTLDVVIDNQLIRLQNEKELKFQQSLRMGKG